MHRPRWLRRETLAEVERDIELAETSRDAYKKLLKSTGPGPIRLYSGEEKATSIRAQLRRDLDDAFTEEERMEVVEHYIRRFMQRQYKRPQAEQMVMRMLQEIQEEY